MDESANSVGYERCVAIEQAGASNHGSGDCVRMMAQTGGQVLFFLGDVAGHDDRAAAMARQLDAWVCALAPDRDPAALLTSLNDTLEARWPTELFVSALCFSLDLQTGTGSIAVAGQLPPIVKGPSCSAPIEVGAGPPLGAVGGQRYRQWPFQLGVGELLVAITDGVTDPLAQESDHLGLFGLAHLVHQAAPEPTDVCATVLAAARRAGLRDDATVLAVTPTVRRSSGQDQIRPSAAIS